MTVPISSVVHVTSWLSREGGGMPPVIWALAAAMQQQGVKTSVAGLQDQWVAEDCASHPVPFMTGKVTGPRAIGFSSDLADHLQNQARPAGIIHSHGLWMYPGLAARNCARRTGNPLMISPHGMLEPWAINHSRFKKKVAGVLFENKNLRSAACLHALCAAEAHHFRQFGLTQPIAIIANGVEPAALQREPDREALTERFPELKGRRRVLFLSRLHPKKGLDNLFRAWKNLDASLSADWMLMIAGSGQPAYEDQLRSLVRELALERQVVFLGPVYGVEKDRALAAADFFVLPSFSEGFSMAILEAAAAGLPVLLTPECNFPELVTAGAALETATDSAGMETGLKQMLKLSDEKRTDMGRRGQRLVGQAYTWPTVTAQLLEVYQWLLHGGPVPKTVQMV